MRRIIYVMGLFALALVAAPLAAQQTAPPGGEVVLTISGETAQAQARDGVQLDLAALREFPAREIRTTTDWHEGLQHFKGVSAISVLESLGFEGAALTATAADKYTVDIPLDDLRAYDAIFAIEWNGDDLREHGEGPVWLIFPYDEMSAEERERYTAWSIWALETIKVRN